MLPLVFSLAAAAYWVPHVQPHPTARAAAAPHVQPQPAARAAAVPQMQIAPYLGLGAAAFLLKESVRVVGTAETQLIERLGRFDRTLPPGLHFLIPLVDRTSFSATTREQVLDIPPQKAITRDNAPLTADAVVYWMITDAELARYAVANLVAAIQNLVLTQLRSEIGKLSLDETFSARAKMNAILLEDLDAATTRWGVKVTRVEVRDIIPSPDIMQAMELQMSAERKKRANVLESEGRRASQVNDATGAADAKILAAEAEAKRLVAESGGEATALLEIAKATDGDLDKAMQILLLSKYGFVPWARCLLTSPSAHPDPSPCLAT